MSWEFDWDKIYKAQGEIQYDVLPTAVMASELFKRANVKTILDLGCGMGRHTIFFAEEGFEVTATDISEKGVEVTKQKALEKGLHIKVGCCDMRNISFDDDSFDSVFCIWTSGHGNSTDMLAHANEMLRVTKPNGFIFVDYVSKEDDLYGVGVEIEKDTFIENTPGEEKIPHHYTDEQEIHRIYVDHKLKISPYNYEFQDSFGNTHHIKTYLVICRK